MRADVDGSQAATSCVSNKNIDMTKQPTKRRRQWLRVVWNAVEVACLWATRVLGVVYCVLIGALIGLCSAVYVGWLRRKVVAARLLPWHMQMLLDGAAGWLMFSAAANFMGAVCVSAGSPDASDVPPPVAVAASGAGGSQTQTRTSTLRTNSELWRWCAVCAKPKPPRAHHCSTCGRCYRRHCHHCPALGRCIGLNNYGFYWRLVATAYAGAGALAVVALGALRAAGPHTRAEGDSLLFTVAVAAAVHVAVAVLLLWHCYLVLTGQTTIECLENWKVRRAGVAPPAWGRWGGPFHRGLKRNVVDAFGSPSLAALPWWSVLIIPARRCVHRT